MLHRFSPRLYPALALGALAILAACSGPSVRTASGPGARIYAEKCASCHGKNGQGAEGKYADALYGDWPVSKLSHYIAKNMPDDKPETLSAAESDAVAAYIYDAFYSRAAQARIHPARIELAHLTNQQYAVAVADLVRRFSPADEPAPQGRGLTATYYSTANRGRFETNKIVHQGLDPQVDFTFAEGSALRSRIGSAEFSMQWRGAIFADETGDYEFTVHTPNSVRVWVNADPANTAEPTLDINVSTPETPDHRFTVRLLGGRSYPIGIDYWALPGKAGVAPPPAIALRWKPPHGSERAIPARNLSPAKVRPTFVVHTRFPADDSSQGYERGIAVSKAWDEAATSAAFEVANHVVKRLDRLAGTFASDAQRAKKIEVFAGKFVAAAFRRPLSDDERERAVTHLLKTAPDAETGMRRVVLLALKSPQFLYTDLPVAGLEVDAASSRSSESVRSTASVKSTSAFASASASTSNSASASASYSNSNSNQNPAAGSRSYSRTAARLSFALWDSIPDESLTQATAAGKLQTRAEVAAQARRMVDDARTRAKLREFFHQWLQIRFVEDLAKDAKLFPDFSPEVVDDLRVSLDLFLDEVVWSERSDFRELLRADYLMANARLARFYGLPASDEMSGDAFLRITARPGERSGVLTHPYLLAALSYKGSSSPIHRGVFLTRSIVGRALKPPPMAQVFDDAQFTPGMTMREKVTRLTRSDSCQGCHSVINPLGFSLEWYDAVGRFRREENGRAIDAVTDYVVDDRQSVRLGGARDVAEFALNNAQANEAFIEQLFQYMVKQPVRAYGPDVLARLRDSFVASGYNIRKLLVDIVTIGALGRDQPALVAVAP